MPNGIFELPPFIVRGNKVSGGDDPFDPYGFNFNNLNRFDNIFDQYDNGGSGGSGDPIVPPVDDSKKEYDPTSLFETKHKEYVKDELYKINQERIKKGQNPITNADYGAIADTLKTLESKIPEWNIEIADQKAALTPRSGASSSNSGIPLIIPIPGIDPITGLAITAAGLIFSGGNVAKLDPANPIQSVIDAGKGTGKTIGNVADVVTGKTDISDILSGKTTAGAGSGAGAGSTAGTGSIAGGENEVIGLDPSGMGTIAVVSTGGSSGGGQPPGGSGNVSVTPGALGGAVRIPGQGGDITTTQTSTPIFTTVPTNRTELTKVKEPDINSNYPGVFNSTANNAGIVTTRTELPKTTEPNTSTDFPGVFTPITTKFNDCPAGQEMKNGACVPIVIAPPKNPTAVTPIVTPTTPTFTFTAPTNTGLAQRDYAKEFGLTTQTLTGKPGDDLAAYYKKLQEQFTPSSLTTLGREAESQLAADMARYTEAQKGNLSQEDVRTAQQGAREAYAARGQVMGQGAIGAEILGRDALQRQREAEARASVQQSMGNLSRAADLQTGNIFSPFASLISQTYSPTNQYAREVYDYNVNAYNAYQAAEKNLAAYKEAAAKGQEAQFINSFVGFLANNGIQTTTNAVKSIIDGLLGGGAKKPAGT